MNQLQRINIQIIRKYCTKPINSINKHPKQDKFLVPHYPTPCKIDKAKLPSPTKIDSATIALLERLSLVDCANREGIETLEKAIGFADQIHQVDTTGVEPLVTVLENCPLRVREDVVTEGNIRNEILKNAFVTEEEYFLAPPGNIPLEAREDLLYENEDKKQ